MGYCSNAYPSQQYISDEASSRGSMEPIKWDKNEMDDYET